MLPRCLLPLALGVLLGTTYSHAQQAPTTLPPPLVPVTTTVAPPPKTTDPFDICALPVTRLVFTLEDLKNHDCTTDAHCASLCWCRTWASAPVTPSTLALCIAANTTSQCVGDARDCKAVLPTPNTTTPASPKATNTTNNGTASNTIDSNKQTETDTPEKHHSGISTTTSVAVALICAAVLVLLLFVANWYRHRPRSISAPATVSSGIQSSGLPRGDSELDAYEEKFPPKPQSAHRGSLPKLGPMHFDSNASIISGVSGASYHDIDGTHLGHLDEDHALTDTELSLSKDKTERVFSPASAEGADSFLSTESSIAMVPLGHRVGAEHYHRLQEEHYYGTESTSSSFLSETSTTYLTNNESFSSQLTIPESDNGSTTSGPREVEF